MKFLATLLGIFPSIIQGITAVEGVVGAGNGASKKQLILNIIDALAKVGESVPVPLVGAISTVIDATVSTFNSVGIFKPSNPAPTNK